MQLANIKKIPDIKEEEFARGEFDMCKAFEDMRAEGKAEGIIEMGQEFGLSDIEIIKILENKLGISTGEAKEYCRSFLSPPDSVFAAKAHTASVLVQPPLFFVQRKRGKM